MYRDRRPEIAEILAAGQDMTVATLRPDGAPQATVVSYASEGPRLYFGCGARSQKAANLARDPRVSVTVTLPYKDWSQIRGLSIGGRARCLTDDAETARVASLFMSKFPEAAQYAETAAAEELVIFEVVPSVVSILDYRKGFGHCELVDLAPLAA